MQWKEALKYNTQNTVISVKLIRHWIILNCVFEHNLLAQ